MARTALAALLLGATAPVAQAQAPSTLSVRVSGSTDDAEEDKANGSVNLSSSDLELVQDGAKNQWIGLRFRNVALPAGVTINRAYVQFTTDEANSGTTNLKVYGQAADNAAAFATGTNNISARARTTAQVAWNSVPAWPTVGAATADQRTPDIKTILQEIVARPGWVSGNALVLLVDGTGHRTANSFDVNNGSGAPQLVIEYTSTSGAFPVAKNSVWRYNDRGQNLGTAWTAPGYDDAAWASERGPFGYGDPVTTTLSFGPDAANKYPTYYFRHAFDVANAAQVDSLLFEVRRDDGAVVYLNGVEIFRQNMPAGPVTHTTLASTVVDGSNETTYFRQRVAATGLVTGRNVLAVEVHQQRTNSSDLSFDLTVRGKPASLPVAAGCNGPDDQHFGCFTSVEPGPQLPGLVLPSSHTFQVLLRQGQAYTNRRVAATASGGNDFTAYVPRGDNSSTLGYLSVNHENTPGAVSLLDMHYDAATKLWVVDTSQAVNFAGVRGTARNCSGGITPWGTVITSEEIFNTGDANADGYEDLGWNVEIDPVTRRVKQYGNGRPEKLWALGRMSHENVAVSADRRTVYEAEDAGSGCVYKFVATTAGNLSAGTLYVLRLDQPLASGDPTGTKATWVVVPNTTVSDRNNTNKLATALGGTAFSGPEDVEIAADGRVYFTSKSNGRTYRFTDNGSTVTGFETFAGGRDYAINFGSGMTNEAWAGGNDNLAFDERGNLYVLQDGARNHVWVLRPGHTPANPQVELFARLPAGAEPTGLTFSPDHKFAFLSIQHPSPTNSRSQRDAAGNPITFNVATTVVIARREFLGGGTAPTTATATATTTTAGQPLGAGANLKVFPNPVNGQQFTASFRTAQRAQVEVSLLDLNGRPVQPLVKGLHERGDYNYPLRTVKKLQGLYLLRLNINGTVETRKVAFE